MLAFCVAAGTLYYVLRPTTLRIAVGPAGSEDQKLVQLMAQTFAREGGSVRLTPVTTEGAAESIALFTAGKADLAVARGDLNLPANAESVAILRKNVVVLWAPSGAAKGSKKKPTPKIKSLDELVGHRVGVIGRTQANVTLLRVILKESGIDPDKVAVSQFATDKIGEMARDQTIDAFMAVGPLKSKITVDAIAATATARGEPKFLPIDVGDAISKKNPVYESEEIPGQHLRLFAGEARRQGRYGCRQSPDHRAEVAVGYGGRRLRTPALHQPPAARARIADRLADRKAGYRQGCRVAGPCRSGGLYRRQRANVP